MIIFILSVIGTIVLYKILFHFIDKHDAWGFGDYSGHLF